MPAAVPLAVSQGPQGGRGSGGTSPQKMVPVKKGEENSAKRWFSRTTVRKQVSGLFIFFKSHSFVRRRDVVLPNVRWRHSARLFLKLSHQNFRINCCRTCEGGISGSVRQDFLSSRRSCWPTARVAVSVCLFLLFCFFLCCLVPHCDAFCRPNTGNTSVSSRRCFDGGCAYKPTHITSKKHP